MYPVVGQPHSGNRLRARSETGHPHFGSQLRAAPKLASPAPKLGQPRSETGHPHFGNRLRDRIRQWSKSGRDDHDDFDRSMHPLHHG